MEGKAIKLLPPPTPWIVLKHTHRENTNDIVIKTLSIYQHRRRKEGKKKQGGLFIYGWGLVVIIISNSSRLRGVVLSRAINHYFIIMQ
jgi:hypothetical protein